MIHDSSSIARSPDLNEMLCFAVHATGFAFNRLYRHPLRRLGLTYPQYLVMVALWKEDGVTVGTLGERLSLDTSTLTPLLKRLERLGLVTRLRSETDERRVIVTLTDKGQEMQPAAAGVARCIAEGAGLTEATLTRLTREIHELRSNLERAAGNLV
jgi:DNA-binding MarR family transcriptional regulator